MTCNLLINASADTLSSQLETLASYL